MGRLTHTEVPLSIRSHTLNDLYSQMLCASQCAQFEVRISKTSWWTEEDQKHGYMALTDRSQRGGGDRGWGGQEETGQRAYVHIGTAHGHTQQLSEGQRQGPGRGMGGGRQRGVRGEWGNVCNNVNYKNKVRIRLEGTKNKHFSNVGKLWSTNWYKLSNYISKF